MKVLSPDALQRLLRQGRRGGAFFVFGDEEFLKDEAVAALTEVHLDPATRDFNFDQLRAGDCSPETLASILATPPMMSEWRVVILRDVQVLATSARGRTTLEELLKQNLPGLLFIMTAQIPSGRAQFYEQLKKLAVPVECPALSDADLPGWLMARAQSRGVTIETDAARLLAGAIGSDLGVLLQELQKLIEFAGDRRTISADDVRAVVTRIPRVSRWEWFDLVADRKFAEARRALPVLLDSGENGVGLVIGLGTQFLRLAIFTAGGQGALEPLLPFNQKWLVGRIGKQARGWTTEALDGALDDLLRADRLLKSTPLTNTQVVEELLLRMQSRNAPVAA
ncbi:MAG: DNA polymerase III subunit delta [Longimicrobiales bacterium]